MEDETWIKLYRKIVKSPIWDNEKALKVWIWCLVKATHIERIQLVGQQKVLLQKGEFIFGRKKASQELQMSESMVYRYIGLLKELKMLNIKSNNKYSVVSIEKWEDYQVNNEDLSNKINNRKTTNEHKQECKEIYLYLFNKYKQQIEKEHSNKKIQIISACQSCKEHSMLTTEEQEALFYDLMRIQNYKT